MNSAYDTDAMIGAAAEAATDTAAGAAMRLDSLLIIADDLSGAADCAIAFASAGRRTMVMLDVAGRSEEGAGTAQVIAADTDTRRLSPDDAARRTADAFRRLAAPRRRLCKKIDSTLRGNWAAEVAALQPLAGLAIVAPSFPATGRTLRDGDVFVHGEPLENTDTWQLENAGRTANVGAMLAAAGLRCEHVGLATLRGHVTDVQARIVAAARAGVQALVFDAQTGDDLRLLAQASALLPTALFWVGSGGLARELAALPDLFGPPPTAMPQQQRHAGAILTLVGSLSAVSNRQCAMLRERAGVPELTVPPAVLRIGAAHADWAGWQAAIGGFLAQATDLLVRIGRDDAFDPAEGAHLSNGLAALIAPHFEQVAGLIVTGGETARAMLVAAGVGMLELLSEVEAGVAVARAATPGARAPAIVTKAGAFGSEHALFGAYQHLRNLPPARFPERDDAASQDMTHPESKERTTMNDSLPVIGITMGDATGVGPEVIVKSLTHPVVYAQCRPLVIGDARRLEQANDIVHGSAKIRRINHADEARYEPGTIDCIDLGLIPEDLPFGKLSPIAGDAAYQYIARAVEMAQSQQIDAICTAPLNKEALHAGGHKFPGHTEMLAQLTGVEEVSMMLVAPQLRVIHVTTHIGIIDAIRKIEPGLVQRTIERGNATLIKAGIARPRIGVCGINPHAGENGLFGYGEEEEKIMPAVKLLQARGLDITGPLPADTLFFRAGRGDFDLVVAMYHDQGHGPVKVLGLEAGVNVTVGLEVIRTSVDHGTAFDIAGKGIADERSLLEALRQGAELATRRAH